jgi:hypothetical protein
MVRANEDPELVGLVRRYVTPDRRYLKLGGSLLRMTARDRCEFLRKLAHAADEITVQDLGSLLDRGWRERKTAAWLIAVAGRAEFRGRLGDLLLASEGPYAGQAYCVALAIFGTPADADLLGGYLDRYLPRLDLYYDQSLALGALLHLDIRLGIERAARFLAPGGLWQRWIDGPPGKGNRDPDQCRRHIARLCSFAEEAARYCGTEPEHSAGTATTFRWPNSLPASDDHRRAAA